MRTNQELIVAVVCQLEAHSVVGVVAEQSVDAAHVDVDATVKLLREGIIKEMQRTPIISVERDRQGAFQRIRITLEPIENVRKAA